MAQALPHRWLCAFVFLLSLPVPVRGQYDPSRKYSNLSEVFPPLQALSTPPIKKPPWLGGQDFTRCCLLAVNESYEVNPDGSVGQDPNADDDFIKLSPADLSNTQFPCGATYNGSDAGAPLVIVPYSWCNQNCGGWQQSKSSALSQWVQPFVGFILPAAVFCLNVPRRVVLAIADGLFRGHLENISKAFKNLKKAFTNLTKASSDLIKALRGHVEPGENASRSVIFDFARQTFGFFIILLLAFLAAVFRGSLAASIALTDTIIWVAVVFSTAGPMILSGLYEAALDRKIIESIQKKVTAQRLEGDDPVFYKSIHLLYAVLVGNLKLHTLESQEPPSEIKTVWEDVNRLVQRPADLNEYKRVTRTRLTGMLGCQASFGAAIGAPVVFFLGSFLFSVISNLSVVGDDDTAHALAFGMWWMTIPHVAIVSGCLLAGNNPNTLEVLVCGVIKDWPPKRRVPSKIPRIIDWYKPFYESAYQPVSMWERGRSKRNWIRRVQIESEPRNENPIKFNPDFNGWLFLILTALGLMMVPFILAFLTSYFTPRVGVSCRSFTFLLYILFQLYLSMIWFWDFHRLKRHPLAQHVRWLPFSLDAEKNERRNAPTFYCIILVLAVLGSIFTAIVGTFLQIIGVYRNCLCHLSIGSWISKDDTVILSTNTADDILYANNDWLPTGVASIVSLIVVCYVGWWYQRHWRMRFRDVIKNLLGEDAPEGPEVNSPEVNSPEVTGLEVKSPEVAGLEVKSPEVTGLEAKGPEGHTGIQEKPTGGEDPITESADVK